jgi:hypothetical protein
VPPSASPEPVARMSMRTMISLLESLGAEVRSKIDDDDDDDDDDDLLLLFD